MTERDPRRQPRRPARETDAPDAEEFDRAMADVVRLKADPRGRVRATPRAHVAATPADAGEGDLRNEDSFAAPGVDRREVRRLKRGEYAVGDRRDLHGMTVAEACEAVERFIANSRHRRLRCVCIVHGRGLHSRAGISTLKGRVRDRLRANASVLAYADAPPADGGPGAVYVLLHR